ncbi:hypothetical protein ACHAWT_009017 [Skeletonema menzelii]
MKSSKQVKKSITNIITALILCTLTTQCCCFIAIKDVTNRLPMYSHSSVSEEAHSATQPPNFSATATFNHDIARTLFPPLFFALYHKKYSNQKQRDDQEIALRQHLKRASPFEDPNSAQTAERMLRRMMENRYRSDGRTVCPDNRTFNLVAGSYGRLRCRNSVTKVPNVGVVWEEEQKRNPQYRLNINNNIDAAEEMISMTSTDKLQELLQLQICLCHYEGWPDEIRPSVDTFNRVLRRLAWRSGNIEFNSRKQTSDADQALLWLKFMNATLPQHFIMEGNHATICSPDWKSISYVIEALASHRIQAFSDRKDTSKPRKTLPIANITEMANEMNIELESNPLSQEDSFSALQKAEELLAMQEEMYKLNRNDKSKQALAHSYKCILEGFGRYAVTSGNSQPQEDAITRAHELLLRLEKLCDAPSSSYASVIFALSISNRNPAAILAEDVLDRMLSKMKSGQVLNAIDVSKAFSGCIAAHVKNYDAPNAETILFKMLDLYESDELGSEFVPEPRAFGTCIAAWSKYDPAADFRERVKWVSSQRQRLINADRAESILVELERVARNEAAKNKNKYVLHATPYNIAILARVQTLEKNTPQARRSNEGIILHAQSILDHMEFEMGVAADPYTYSILLNAWTKQSCPGNEKAADNAEELLRRRIEDVDISNIYSDDDPSAKTVDDVWPNVKHYSSVLKAHANCRSPAGARKALSLLSEMEKRFYDANVISDGDEEDADFHVDQKDAAKPDLVCYSIVIDAFAKQKQLSEASSVALRLLRAMEEKYYAGDMSMKPNNRIYTAVILSLANSPYNGDDAEKLNNAQRAWSLLDEMKANDVRPNSFTYNYIINCCAQEASQDENEKRISFEIAIKAFQELRKMTPSSNNDDNGDSCSTDAYHPDSFTYAFTLKACTNLLTPSPFRTKVATQVFKECCKKGYCNDEVMKRLRWCVDTDSFYALIGTDTRDVRIDDMPSSWSRCCLPNKRRRNNPSY